MRWTTRLAVLALALAACGAPGDSEGADGGTGGGDGCTESGNLVRNAHFECGGDAPGEWVAAYGDLDFPPGEGRGGGRAARVTMANALGARLAYTPALLADGGSSTACVTAWAKGTAPFMRVRVLRDTGTGVEFNAPLTADWQRVPPTLVLVAPNEGARTLTLVFELQTNRSDGQNGKPGDALFIDDVDAWLSPSGRCDEAR